MTSQSQSRNIGKRGLPPNLSILGFQILYLVHTPRLSQRSLEDVYSHYSIKEAPQETIARELIALIGNDWLWRGFARELMGNEWRRPHDDNGYTHYSLTGKGYDLVKAYWKDCYRCGEPIHDNWYWTHNRTRMRHRNCQPKQANHPATP